MNLHVSIVLLFIFITGGHSLRCYVCMPDLSGDCKAREETCPSGATKCSSTTGYIDLNKMSVTTKSCENVCEANTASVAGVRTVRKCCDTDLCNAADGVYKGSLILLLCPLLFYFLFH